MKRRWWIPALALLFIGGLCAGAMLLVRPPYPFLGEAEVYQFKVWPKGRFPDLTTITYAFKLPYSEVVSRARRDLPGKWLETKKSAYHSLLSIHEWREPVRPKTGAYSDIPAGTTCTVYMVRQATFGDRFRVWLHELRGTRP